MSAAYSPNTIVVIGATSGLGRAAAMALAARGIHVEEAALVPGLIYDGNNTFVLTRTGEHIHMEINDVQAADFDHTNYNSSWFMPNLFAYALDTHNVAYGFTLQSVEVEY